MKPKKASKNGAARKKRMPKWKRMGEYRAEDMVKVTFLSEADLDAGTALVWGGRLTGVPFDLDPNSDSFFIPKASVPYFLEAGIKITHKPAYPKTDR